MKRAAPSLIAVVGFVVSVAAAQEPAPEVVQARVAGIRACYEAELRHDPTFSGVRAVRFRVLASGRIERVRLVSATPRPALLACVVRVMRRLPYPPRTGGPTDVELPLTSDAP